jgi:tryptophan halogenase
MRTRFEEVRDFLILHYCATERTDTPFWQYCANMSIPDSLARRIEMFRQRGHCIFHPAELFVEASWVAVYLGQNIIPETYDPRVRCTTDTEIQHRLQQIRSMVAKAADEMASHASVVKSFCNAA